TCALAWLEQEGPRDEHAAKLLCQFAEIGSNLFDLRSDPTDRVALHSTANRIPEFAGDTRKQASHLGSLGQAHLDLANTHEALSLFAEQLRSAQAVGDRAEEQRALSNAGQGW